jgi:hypothetical protein
MWSRVKDLWAKVKDRTKKQLKRLVSAGGLAWKSVKPLFAEHHRRMKADARYRASVEKALKAGAARTGSWVGGAAALAAVLYTAFYSMLAVA